MSDEYEPTWKSLDSHETPEWYHDAKLGIFIHWGPYSVPAWAPSDHDIQEAIDNELTDSPYAEWYGYFMYREDSRTYEYHRETYGEDVGYDEFLHEWKAEHWDPEEWAEFFADIGAGYVVLTGEHCDGFPLWDSHYVKYDAAEVGPERDLVGDLSTAVRDAGMRFAASYHANVNWYQPGFEGLWGHPDYEGRDFSSEETGPGSEYVDFMNAKHRELIRKYEPDLLWFDVPKADSEHLNAKELIADYYNAAAEWGKEVAVNDRSSTDARGHLSLSGDDSTESHTDFLTPEYMTVEDTLERKWELCRGVGLSFGYNATEGAENHLTGDELIRLFVDVVSKNGNLLINVGPRADGTIPDLQREPLETLGKWLDTHGEAIFGSTYWVTAEDPRETDIRYTWKDGTLYATCFDWPTESLSFDLGNDVEPDQVTGVTLIGGDELRYTTAEGTLDIQIPERVPSESAGTVRIEGVSDPRA